jgi:hypothetical protein
MSLCAAVHLGLLFCRPAKARYVRLWLLCREGSQFWNFETRYLAVLILLLIWRISMVRSFGLITIITIVYNSNASNFLYSEYVTALDIAAIFADHP